MNQDLKKLLDEAKKRNIASPSSDRQLAALKADLFDLQLAALEHPAKFKALLCGRRAGKTALLARAVCYAALEHPHREIPIVEVARTTSAARSMWKALEDLNTRMKLGGEPNLTEQSVSFPNGSRVFLVGAATVPECEKLRGAGYSLCVIDEAGSWRPAVLEYLLSEVLEPALADYNGALWMAGTPTNHASGPFYNATATDNPGWQAFRWTMLDNKFMPHARGWLDGLRIRRGWTEDHPVYRREYLGHWIRDADSFVYKYEALRNLVSKSELTNPRFVIGLDLGWKDATAWAVLGWSRSSPNVEILESFKESFLIPSRIAEITYGLRERYPNAEIVADTGGLGRSIVEEFRQRHFLNIEAAEKQHKRAAIELLNGDLISGRLKILRGVNEDLIDEYQTLQWDESREKEDGRFNNHLADAALYAFRKAKHFAFREPTSKPHDDDGSFWTRAVERELRALDRPPQKKRIDFLGATNKRGRRY